MLCSWQHFALRRICRSLAKYLNSQFLIRICPIQLQKFLSESNWHQSTSKRSTHTLIHSFPDSKHGEANPVSLVLDFRDLANRTWSSRCCSRSAVLHFGQTKMVLMPAASVLRYLALQIVASSSRAGLTRLFPCFGF
jgi:hypothetical protein